MHPRIEEVLNYLDGERSALREAVELVSPELRDQSPGPDRWSVAQVLQHLASIENRIGMGMTKWIADARAGGTGPETETSSVVNNLVVQAIA
ncbi:MAG TPA: DinB family protein, partial [Pyrinomonadaceae bacterium]|nr:DinB family protein [Pyrinomonadaceae bacterium]